MRKTAIVCDWLVSRGGAERVILELADMFPLAPIYTSIFDPEKFPELAHRAVHTSFLQRFPFAKRRHHFLLPLMPHAFENFDFNEFDLVISSCHSCAKGIITKPSTMHISYCHTPMRYLWDGCHDYFQRFAVNRALEPAARAMLSRLRVWDRAAADRVDAYIANSNFVAARIKKYYRRESRVIYPPVDTSFFSLPPEAGRYFLACGRLTSYKRFDLLVEVFNDLALPLVIVGTGKDEKKLKSRAGRFITFAGAVTDDELRILYSKATALVFPQLEDFGITPIEAMSAGKPVIAFKGGGALETVIEGKTGIFFEHQTAASLKTAVLEFTKLSWNSERIRSHAKRFDTEVFQRTFREFIDETVK